ncbi:hypothetical protein LCGC14_0353550 [marine sediment metagenome]|uniref:Uncharacterized protein n=1 Tax=marine sediment metagenome TaxID=412755 RepID=A0A0F9WI77_9ZZZZ
MTITDSLLQEHDFQKGDSVMFRMGERMPVVCPGCGYKNMIDNEILKHSGQVFQITSITSPPGGRCIGCETQNEVGEAFRFTINAKGLHPKIGYYDGIVACARELTLMEAAS